MLITSAAKITRHLADMVNYPLRFNQSRTRVKFEYIIIHDMNVISCPVTCSGAHDERKQTLGEKGTYKKPNK